MSEAKSQDVSCVDDLVSRLRLDRALTLFEPGFAVVPQKRR
jgi:hypothetical protein